MANKHKGSRTERELIHMFYEQNYAPVRIAGSGSTPLPSPDMVVGGFGKIFAIECKSGKTTRYIKKEQMDELLLFSSRFGAEALIGVRFDREGWFFLKPEQIDITKGGSYSVSLEDAKQKGLSFGKLIGKEI